jgi:syntaxin 1B/2/3
MNDLLADSSHKAAGGINGGDLDIENGMSIPPVAGQDMSQFFSEVNDIKNGMVDIRKKFQKLQDANEETKSVTRAAAMKELKERMEHDLDDVSRVAQGLKVKVEALDRANVSNRKIKGCHEGSSTDRTRMSITATLKKKLKDLMLDFQALRQRFQEEYREVVERRVYTVTGQKVDESVIEQLIETGDSEQIFQRAIQEQGRGQILDTIAEIQERHDAVRDIEKKLLELHQIFLDMAVLVEAQGELLDNIETQVGKAVDHVASGTQQLQKAKRSQRATSKCVIIAIMLLLVAILIIVLVVIQPWKTKK